VIIAVGTWLSLRRPSSYTLLRNAFVISGAIGLVIFATFPVAPPRLANLAVVDTVTLHSYAYRVLQPPAFVNQYAAVPSLHFGWNLLIGLVLIRTASAWPWKVFGCILPVLMAYAVIATANHFILDVVAGAGMALTGLLFAWCLQCMRPRPLLAPPTDVDAS
jgi:membrane-associated phospholipid phosphatase